MLPWPSLDEIARVLGAAALGRGSERVTAISTDTRTAGRGALFVALRGERFDGHGFVRQALDRGAAAAVVERWFRASDLPERQLLRVASPLGAYQALARWRRRLVARPVVAITGSVGKTTTKELVVAALRRAGSVLATPANQNNEVGVPRALLALEPAHRFAVLEMGMRGRGQIRELGELAEPDIAVITNTGTAHIGLLGSREAIAQAKCELLETLRPGGLALLNAHCPLLLETARRVWSGRTLTYGLGAGEWRGELAADGRLRVDGHLVTPPLRGEHHALNLLAALAVARQLGVPWAALEQLQVELPPGRARRLELPGGIVVVDDTYNAGMESTVAALRLLATEPARRRIAVLGTMRELGAHSVALHEQVGRAAAAAGIDALLVLAEPAEAAALTRGAAGVPTVTFGTAAELTAHAIAHARAGDCWLFKASRAVALDRVVAALQAAREGA